MSVLGTIAGLVFPNTKATISDIKEKGLSKTILQKAFPETYATMEKLRGNKKDLRGNKKDASSSKTTALAGFSDQVATSNILITQSIELQKIQNKLLEQISNQSNGKSLLGELLGGGIGGGIGAGIGAGFSFRKKPKVDAKKSPKVHENVEEAKKAGGGKYRDSKNRLQEITKNEKTGNWANKPVSKAEIAEAIKEEGMLSKLWSGVKSVSGKILNKVAAPVLCAYACWEAYEAISKLEPTDPNYKKNITKIVSELIGRFGLTIVATMLGTIAAGVVSGPGAIVGFIGGLSAGLVADYLLGNSVDAIVDALVDKLWPKGAVPVNKENITSLPAEVIKTDKGEDENSVVQHDTIDFNAADITFNADEITINAESSEIVKDQFQSQSQSQPLLQQQPEQPPQYAIGTSYAKGGPAIVGERGSEQVINRQGNSRMTASGAHVERLNRGDRVIPANDVHNKSRSMFQAAQDAERRGENSTALFFAADRQRQAELSGVKTTRSKIKNKPATRKTTHPKKAIIKPPTVIPTTAIPKVPLPPIKPKELRAPAFAGPFSNGSSQTPEGNAKNAYDTSAPVVPAGDKNDSVADQIANTDKAVEQAVKTGADPANLYDINRKVGAQGGIATTPRTLGVVAAAAAESRDEQADKAQGVDATKIQDSAKTLFSPENIAKAREETLGKVKAEESTGIIGSIKNFFGYGKPATAVTPATSATNAKTSQLPIPSIITAPAQIPTTTAPKITAPTMVAPAAEQQINPAKQPLIANDRTGDMQSLEDIEKTFNNDNEYYHQFGSHQLLKRSFPELSGD